MSENKLDKVKGILELLQNETITPKQLKLFLEGVLSFIKNSKIELDSSAKESIDYIKAAVGYVNQITKKTLSEMDKQRAQSDETFKEKMKLLTKMMQEILNIKVENGKPGEPGKDADEDAVAEKVLDGVKKEMPQHIMNHVEDIANALETLEGDERLKASAIAGLAEMVADMIPTMAKNTVGGGVQEIQSPSGLTVTSSLFKENNKRRGRGVVSISIPVQDTAPENPFLNQLWVDTS